MEEVEEDGAVMITAQRVTTVQRVTTIQRVTINEMELPTAFEHILEDLQGAMWSPMPHNHSLCVFTQLRLSAVVACVKFRFQIEGVVWWTVVRTSL